MAMFETASANDRSGYVDRITLSRAVVAGVVGGLAFGLVIQFAVGRMGAIGALYNFGEPSITIGWVAHGLHSVVFGAIFGLVTEQEPFHSWMEHRFLSASLVGIGFGVALYAVNIMFVWPYWLATVGFPPAAGWSIPFTPVAPLLGHLVFGVILGSTFHLLVDY